MPHDNTRGGLGDLNKHEFDEAVASFTEAIRGAPRAADALRPATLTRDSAPRIRHLPDVVESLGKVLNVDMIVESSRPEMATAVA